MNEPAIRALIAKWRDAAVWEHDDMSNVQAAQTFDQCADELEALLAAGDAAETPEWWPTGAELLRHVELYRKLSAAVSALDPAAADDQPQREWTAAKWAVFNAAVRLVKESAINAASLSPAVPPQEDERVIPPFLHPGYVIRKAKPQPHHGIDCGCADCAIPSTAETPPVTDKP